MKTPGIRSMAFAALLCCGAANANPAYDYFELYGYEDELARCVELIRPVLQAKDGEKVTYDVQEIDLRGPWYNFEISTTLVDTQGNKQVDAYKIGCRSNRWVESVKLVERRNSQPLPLRLELLASNF